MKKSFELKPGEIVCPLYDIVFKNVLIHRKCKNYLATIIDLILKDIEEKTNNEYIKN